MNGRMHSGPRALRRRLLLLCLLSALGATVAAMNSKELMATGSRSPIAAEAEAIHLSVQGLATGHQAGSDSAMLRIGLNPPTTNATARRAEVPGGLMTGLDYEHSGIRYTRMSLLTQPEPRAGLSDPDESRIATIPVLLVHLVGENTSSEYTDASASLSLELDGRPLELQLDAGILRGRLDDDWMVLGAIRVPAEGVEPSTDPRLLKFRGHMPPGTSGSMTIKIPTCWIDSSSELDWLIDLEFDEELRRLQRLVKARRTAGAEE